MYAHNCYALLRQRHAHDICGKKFNDNTVVNGVGVWMWRSDDGDAIASVPLYRLFVFFFLFFRLPHGIVGKNQLTQQIYIHANGVFHCLR